MPTSVDDLAKEREDWLRSSPHALYEGEEAVLIPHDEIIPNLYDYDEGRVGEYEAAMRAGDAFPPITVQRYAHEKKWRIRNGSHRDIASRQNGYTSIPALPLEASGREPLSYPTAT